MPRILSFRNVLAVVIAVSAIASVSLSASAADEPHAGNDNRITVLYDAFSRNPSLHKDWGFAALLEINGKRILFDTGNNAEIFAKNIAELGVDLKDLDFAIVSHRHGDHIGGLNHLLAVNSDVPIFAPKENFGVFGAEFPGTFYRKNDALSPDRQYFDGHPPERLTFGTPWPQADFTWIAETTEIMPGFHIIALRGLWGVDLEVRELSLAVETAEGIVLIIGCGHPMVEKIVEAASNAISRPIHMLIGGLHLLPANHEQTVRIAANLRDQWRVEWIAPAHCTGETAFEILADVFDARYLYAGLGTTLSIGPGVRAYPAGESASHWQWGVGRFAASAAIYDQPEQDRHLHEHLNRH